jgi:hypothetical protein
MQSTERISLNRARQLPILQREGRHVDLSTMWRWATRGCRGITLATEAIGGRRYTTVANVERFLHALNSGAADATAPTPTQQKREIESSRRRLAAAGI